MALYEWNDGQLGAVCLQGGPKGEGGLDDATGASGAAGGAGLKQTSATLDLSEHCLGLCGAAWTNRGVSCTCLALAPSNFHSCRRSAPRPQPTLGTRRTTHGRSGAWEI